MFDRSRSIPGHRAQLTLAARVPNHMAAAAAAFGRTRQWRWWLAGAVSVSADLLLARLLRDDDGFEPMRLPRALINTVDALVWTRATRTEPAPESVRYHALASIVPGTIEEAMRLRGGRAALPALGERPATNRGVRIGRVVGVASVAAPAVVTQIVRRRSGQRASLGEDLGWVLLAGGAGFALAHVRERLHADAHERWRKTTDTVTIGEAHALRAVAANRETSGHAFKRTFLTLAGLLDSVGDQRGRELALEELQRCEDEEMAAYQRAIGELGGTLLAHVASRTGVAVNPIEAGVVWLSDKEASRLAQRLADGDGPVSKLEEGVAVLPSVTVLDSGWDWAVVSIGGHVERFGRQAQSIETNLDPARLALVLGAVWKLTSLSRRFGGVPALAVLPAVGIDLVTLHRHLSDPALPTHDRPPPDSMFVASIVSLLWCGLPVAMRRTSERTADGWPLNPPAEQATLLLLGHYWHHLTPGRRAAVVAVCTATWLQKAWRPERRGRPGAGWELLAEAMNPVTVLLCALNLDRRVAGESDELERRVGMDFRSAVEAARRKAIAPQVASFRRQLVSAERLRRRLSRHTRDRPELSEPVLELRQSITRFRGWLADLEADDLDAPVGDPW